MNVIAWISLALLVLYVLKIQKFWFNWKRYPEFKPSGSVENTGISVVIAFRNEISYIPFLLSALKRQEYPSGLYEVILVNDHSDDGSDILVRDFCTEHPNFRLVQNDEGSSGKKSALRKGIMHASFEFIVTTDADCVMKPQWLSTFAQFYREKNPDMVIGLVGLNTSRSFFGAFQEAEFLSLVASGAASAAGNDPVFCNGACMAYRKDLFNEYPDPMNGAVASGDDTFLMLTVKRKRRSGILLLKALDAVAVTRGADTWRSFFNQRKRWISKSIYYRDFSAVYLALLVFLVSLFMLNSLVLLGTGISYWLFPVMYTGKMLADIVFMSDIFRYFGKKLHVIWFLLFELIYPFYVVIFALAGISTGFSWKGRRFG